MRSYRLNRHLATIEGPVQGTSTRGGLRTTLFRVVVGGRPVFHAPSRVLCHDWLVRQGYRPD